MTSNAQLAANRRNAAGSTGPRTAEGKARTAQNARRHGATGAPSQAQVATWFRVIRGHPRVSPADLLHLDRTAEIALRLAEAEAQLTAARNALEHHRAARRAATERRQLPSFDDDDAHAEEDEADDPPTPVDLDEAGAEILKWWTDYFRDLRAGKLGSIENIRWLREQIAPGEERLLLRYAREAQGRRNRAFRAWIAHQTTLQSHAPDEKL